jgi:FAD-dependent urate hydroxylase
MWWTNWVIPREYTPDEIRDTSDINDMALELFKDRKLMFPCRELIDKTTIWAKASIFDIRSLPSWHKSRICLIGDAAHAVCPNSPVSKYGFRILCFLSLLSFVLYICYWSCFTLFI